MNADNFQNAVVYQIYVRSFQDSDGDGVGDLRGVIARLPYIASLGVEYIWLNPIYPSPQCDNGYDVADYKDIDPLFGGMGDFEELVAAADRLGIGVMMDMVFNHTSTEHPWFKRAWAGDREYRDYYFFVPSRPDGSPPCNWRSKFGGSAWENVPGGDEYYLHLYARQQADLNWRNPAVREALFDVVRFWKGKGVRGFRFDVINLISKPECFVDDNAGDGRRFYTDGPRVEEYLRQLRAVVNEGVADARGLITVGELSSTSPEKCFRYGGGDSGELSMIFHFHHLKSDYANPGDKWLPGGRNIPNLTRILHYWQVEMQRHNAWDALFWNNHDQPRAVTRFASDDPAHHFHGATMLAAAMHLMRGVPYIYQGEEIGMIDPGFADISSYRDVETLNCHRILLERGDDEASVMAAIRARSRDNSRTPMQWDDSPRAGFTSGTPWIDAAASKAWINVAAEEKKDDGILAFYRKLIKIRKQSSIIQYGSYTPFLSGHTGIFAYVREWTKERLYCLNNFSEETVELSPGLLSAAPDAMRVFVSNYGVSEVVPGHGIVLRPYETLSLLCGNTEIRGGGGFVGKENHGGHQV